MITFALSAPITVGDFSNRIVIDKLQVQSISVRFDLQSPVLSIVLVHLASGWQHVVTYTDASAAQFWSVSQAQGFVAIVSAFVQKLMADGKLPPGSLQ